MRCIGLVAALVVLMIPSLVWARKVEPWTYDRLFKEADLVVIGSVESFSGSDETWPEAIFEKDRFEALSTVFQARSVLKGEAPLSIRVVHFRYREGSQPYEDGPGLVSFPRQPVLVEVRPREVKDSDVRELAELKQGFVEMEPPEYLLFLRNREDGQYEPVSGQMDAVFSVRALFHPWHVN